MSERHGRIDWTITPSGDFLWTFSLKRDPVSDPLPNTGRITNGVSVVRLVDQIKKQQRRVVEDER